MEFLWGVACIFNCGVRTYEVSTKANWKSRAVKPANLIKPKNLLFFKFPEVPTRVREYMHGGYAPDRYVDSPLTSLKF